MVVFLNLLFIFPHPTLYDSISKAKEREQLLVDESMSESEPINPINLGRGKRKKVEKNYFQVFQIIMEMNSSSNELSPIKILSPKKRIIQEIQNTPTNMSSSLYLTKYNMSTLNGTALCMESPQSGIMNHIEFEVNQNSDQNATNISICDLDRYTSK
ncbi:hypothetical protein QTP88_018326 [Uroleucon formosanum]